MTSCNLCATSVITLPEHEKPPDGYKAITLTKASMMKDALLSWIEELHEKKQQSSMRMQQRQDHKLFQTS